MTLFKSLFSLLFFIPAISMGQANTTYNIKSADQKTEVTLALNQDQALSYSVRYLGKDVLFPSTLGVEFKTGGLFEKNLSIISSKNNTGKETYDLYSGKSSKATAEFNEISFVLQEKAGMKRKLEVVFRVYNEGVAFRYQFPQQEKMKTIEIIRENNVFCLKHDPTLMWPMIVPNFTTSYEDFYDKKLLNNIHPDFLMAMPLTMQIPDGPHICITEAALNDYAGSYIKKIKDQNNKLTTVLSPLPGGKGIAVKAKPGHKSPWRVIMIGENAGDLIESNLIYHLNDPNVLQDVSWIKPGKCAWDWWSEAMVKNQSFTGGMNTQTMKYFIDFASEFKLEYMLIDAGWSGKHDDTLQDMTKPIAEINMKEIIEYAKGKNVGIILWVNWKCVKNQMDKAFPVYQQWGVKGIKMDYMDRDDQEMVNFYLQVVKKAAENKLMVNMHGAHKPSGLSRTYPNLMTYEGIRGMEYNKWARTTPTHHVTIPFTRMLAGPMDVTPGVFRNVTEEDFVSQGREAMAIGTRCSQLAMFVVYESGLQSLCDYPDAYRGQKGVELLKVVPVSWDETRVLAGEVGEYIIIARRKGDDWFIAGMTNETEREVLVPMSLVWNKKFQVTIYQDGKKARSQPTDVTVETKETGTGPEQFSYVAKMVSGGGFVIHFKAIK
ncbi:MAG: glycoside hydrolase family 97 protein [Cytophagaceae bacterium]|nr:glycoside hydrolase family 97 protein [Cytophagaceae bacterium]